MRKKVKLTLVGLDSNAFSLMAAFKRQAQKEGWLAAEIAAILDECKKGDYDPDEEEEEEAEAEAEEEVARI